MPGIDGFEVLRRLSGSDMPIVIFVTAYDEFAFRAFEANALDYLLKPINDDRLGEAIERARQARDEKLACAHRTKLLKLVCELTGKELTLEGAITEAAQDRGSFPERLSIRDAGEPSMCRSKRSSGSMRPVTTCAFMPKATPMYCVAR